MERHEMKSTKTTYQTCTNIIEESLDVKPPTIWTDEKAEVRRFREEKRREEMKKEDQRKSLMQVREKVEKSPNTMFLRMFCGSRASKLAKATGSGQMRDAKLHAVLARNTF